MGRRSYLGGSTIIYPRRDSARGEEAHDKADNGNAARRVRRPPVETPDAKREREKAEDAARAAAKAQNDAARREATAKARVVKLEVALKRRLEWSTRTWGLDRRVARREALQSATLEEIHQKLGWPTAWLERPNRLRFIAMLEDRRILLPDGRPNPDHWVIHAIARRKGVVL